MCEHYCKDFIRMVTLGLHPSTDSKRPVDQLVSGVFFFSGGEMSANGQAKKTAEEVSFEWSQSEDFVYDSKV